jgi:hypothetical protein
MWEMAAVSYHIRAKVSDADLLRRRIAATAQLFVDLGPWTVYDNSLLQHRCEFRL